MASKGTHANATLTINVMLGESANSAASRCFALHVAGAAAHLRQWQLSWGVMVLVLLRLLLKLLGCSAGKHFMGMGLCIWLLGTGQWRGQALLVQ